MTDSPSHPRDLPPGAIHLGTFTARGTGKHVLGVVKLRSDPKDDLLQTADSFLKAADRCLTSCKEVPGVEMLTVPGAVCAALSCELYLKFMHLVESWRLPHDHDLLDLFMSLRESTRTALVGLRADVAEVLERNRSHFVAARYHHEVAQFSFRQAELLQLAGTLSAWVHSRGDGAGDAALAGA